MLQIKREEGREKGERERKRDIYIHISMLSDV
jgi:hypothetical protein